MGGHRRACRASSSKPPPGGVAETVRASRYKHDIRDMAGKSSALLKLRPVTFRYNNDPAETLQYGLVAEEVAKVYPELVVYGPDGKVMTVRYLMLSAMLLNELQKQTRQQADQNRKLAAQVAELKANQEHQRVAFEQRVATLERALASRESDGKLAAAFNR